MNQEAIVLATAQTEIMRDYQLQLKGVINCIICKHAEIVKKYDELKAKYEPLLVEVPLDQVDFKTHVAYTRMRNKVARRKKSVKRFYCWKTVVGQKPYHYFFCTSTETIFSCILSW